MKFEFTTNEDYAREAEKLAYRHARAVTIAGTQSHHCFVPVSADKLEMKEFSIAKVSKTVSAIGGGRNVRKKKVINTFES